MERDYKRFFKSILCSIAIIGVLSFVSEKEIRDSSPPPFIGSIVEPFKNKGVFVQAKAYSSEESRQYLNRDLLKKGYQPVQVTIQNNTGKIYLLSHRGVDIETVSPSAIANHISARSIPRSIAFKIAGLLFWPMLIPGAIDGIFTFKTHLSMKSDYYAKSIKEEEALLPYSTANRILFIPADQFAKEFTLYLQEGKSREFLAFAVKINT